jgi:hypothetical protein
MDALVSQIASTVFEALVAGIVVGGVLLLVRRIQIAAGVKDEREQSTTPLLGAR